MQRCKLCLCPQHFRANAGRTILLVSSKILLTRYALLTFFMTERSAGRTNFSEHRSVKKTFLLTSE